jgi:glutamine synthetase
LQVTREAALDAPLPQRLCDGLESAGITVEALNPETGPGQYEINTRYASAPRRPDRAETAPDQLTCVSGV